MAGYTRQSSADIIATAVVRANPLNVEYNALRDAFSASSGHKHDGTAAEGAYVPLIADSDALNKVVIDTANNRVGVFVQVSNAAVEQIRIQDGAIVPVTSNDIDFGTSSLQFKNLYLDGTATIDILQVDESATITANLTVNGNTTLGNAATDTVTVTADVASPLLPSADDTYDLGAVGSEWRNLYVDGTANIDALVADTADINGGTVDGAVIGGASAAAGTFTSLNASGTATLATVDINAGNIDGTVIGAASAAAITGTTITGTSFVGDITGDVTGNADTATALATARTIGGVSFNGTANINLPGVNAAGNQDTSGTAADATILETARTIGGVSFNGSADINLPGVNAAGNQNTSGTAAEATILATARTIAGNSFNGSANITIAATDLSDTDQSLATGDNVTFASVTGNLTGNVTSTGANSFGSLTVSGAATLNGNTIIGNAATDTVTVTADVASNLIPSADSSYSLGDSSNYWSHGYIDAVTTTGNVIVGGDLTVNGTTTTVATTNMTVSDALIELGTGTTGTPSNDAGIVIERGNAANAFMGYDESADKFTVGTGTFTGATTGNLSITTGTLVANVEGNVTGNVTGSSGSTTGNAATATALETARTIGGVSFNGTGNINLPGVNASGTQDTSGNADTATALATARTIAGQSFNGTANITIAPTDLTGVNSTATELNIMDGGTSASSTTLADADRVVVNDAGTMKQVALTDFETYFEGALDTLSNVTTVGALNSGTITSGFGAIDNGSSAITTTGTVTYGSLSDGTITITGFVDEDNMASNSATLIPTQQSVEARIQAVSSTANNVTGLNATGTEINTVADFSAVSVDTSTAIASNDALLVFDNGNNIGYRDVDLLDTYFSATTKTLTNKTITSPIITGMHLNDSGFTVEGSGEDGNDTTVAFTNPTADRTITFTDASGTVLLEGKANSIDSDMYVDGSIDTAHIADGQITAAKLGADSVTAAKIGDNVLNSEHYAAGSIDTEHLADGQVTAAKLSVTGNGTTSQFLRSDADGTFTWATPTDTNTTYSVGDGGLTQVNFTTADNNKLDAIAASANNYVHPNHSGEVTSTADGATVIADNIVDEANLKVSNSPTNGHVLTAQSGNTGGLTWSVPSSGNVVDDTSPQLGGNLDTNSNNILIDDAHFIGDENGNEQVVFQTTASAVNHLEITNNATGSNPILAAVGGDTNIGIALTPKGTGEIVIGAGNLNYGGTAVTSTGAELNILDGVTATATELNILDGVTATTAELNYTDGVTSAIQTQLNTKGVTAGSSSIVTTGALNSGSITSGFGNIDNGASAITTTGLISGGSLDIDNVLINGTTIGHTDDTDLITLANGLVTVAGEISVTTLDIGGTNVTSTAAELNILDGVTSTAAELNILDGVTSTAAELNLLDGKAFLDEDNLSSNSATGIASQQSIKAYVDASTSDVVDDTSPQLGGNLDSNGKNINIGDTTAYGDNNTINVGAGGDLKIFHDGSNSYIIDASTGNLKIGSNGTGVDIVQDNPLSTGYIARFLENNGVELYYAKAKKFELSSTGVAVTGNVVVSGTVDGRDVATDGTKLDTIALYASNESSPGAQPSATGVNAIALGDSALSAQIGKYTYASGRFSATGDVQGATFILRADTTDATATVLTTNNASAAATNQVVAAADTCITFDGTITAMQNGAQAYASWRIEGLLVNDNGTTTLANSATTVIINESEWVMALTADNTNNALAITCTGEASHNIRWVANLRTSEVTFA